MKLEKIQRPDYVKVRQAMAQGARTIEDIKSMTDLDTVEYENDIKAILANICSCKNISMEQVTTLAKEGKSLEEIKEITKASTACGRCANLLEAVVSAAK